jgi:hypothetical protein
MFEENHADATDTFLCPVYEYQSEQIFDAKLTTVVSLLCEANLQNRHESSDLRPCDEGADKKPLIINESELPCIKEEGESLNSDSDATAEHCSLRGFFLEATEENEFEYLEIENKIEHFQGSFGFAFFQQKII